MRHGWTSATAWATLAVGATAVSLAAVATVREAVTDNPVGILTTDEGDRRLAQPDPAPRTDRARPPQASIQLPVGVGQSASDSTSPAGVAGPPLWAAPNQGSVAAPTRPPRGASPAQGTPQDQGGQSTLLALGSTSRFGLVEALVTPSGTTHDGQRSGAQARTPEPTRVRSGRTADQELPGTGVGGADPKPASADTPPPPGPRKAETPKPSAQGKARHRAPDGGRNAAPRSSARPEGTVQGLRTPSGADAAAAKSARGPGEAGTQVKSRGPGQVKAKAKSSRPSQATAKVEAKPGRPSQATAKVEAKPGRPSQATAKVEAKPGARGPGKAEVKAKVKAKAGGRGAAVGAKPQRR